MFPRTQLATAFTELKTRDAEVAIEIAYRMRMALFHSRLSVPPMMLLLSSEGSPQVKIGNSIAEYLVLRFGDLPIRNIVKRKRRKTSRSTPAA